VTEIPCVGAIVLDGDGRLLLVRRANPPAQGLWSIPGGRVEPGEDWADAVVRELAEETGVEASVDRFVGEVRRDAPDGGVYVIRDYVMRLPEQSAAQVPSPIAGDDALAAAWFTPDEVRSAKTSPGLVDALSSWGLL
jgi:ADP-ribose pyrophosphatase YjhB (NUDIX family)